MSERSPRRIVLGYKNSEQNTGGKMAENFKDSKLVENEEGKKIEFTNGNQDENTSDNKPITIESLSEIQAQAKNEKSETKNESQDKSIYDIGQDRMNKIGGFFSRIGEKISNGWSRIKEIASDIGVNILAFPELVKAGGKEIARSTKEDIVAPGVKAVGKGVEFVKEKGNEAIDTGKKFFKEELEKTQKDIESAKKFASDSWTEAKKHGKMAVDTVVGIGQKVETSFNTTKDKTKEAIEKKLTELKEYSDSVKSTAEGIKDSASEAIKSVVQKTEKAIGDKISEVKAGIENKMQLFKDKMLEAKLRGEERRKEKEEAKALRAEAKKQKELQEFYDKAIAERAKKAEEVAALEKFIAKYEEKQGKK